MFFTIEFVIFAAYYAHMEENAARGKWIKVTYKLKLPIIGVGMDGYFVSDNII